MNRRSILLNFAVIKGTNGACARRRYLLSRMVWIGNKSHTSHTNVPASGLIFKFLQPRKTCLKLKYKVVFHSILKQWSLTRFCQNLLFSCGAFWFSYSIPRQCWKLCSLLNGRYYVCNEGVIFVSCPVLSKVMSINNTLVSWHAGDWVSFYGSGWTG